MIYQIIFVLSGCLIDFLLSVIFPIDYAFFSPVFIPSVSVIALMLVIKQLSVRDSLFFSFTTGFIWAFFFPETVWSYAVIYMILALLIKIWSMNMTESFLELLILSLLTIFAKELLLYGYMSITKVTDITIWIWAQKILFVTIIGNIPFACMMILFSKLKDDFMSVKQQEKTRKERILWEALK